MTMRTAPPYPNLRKGLVVGLIAGLVAAVSVFGLCFWCSTLTPLWDGDLTWAFRPWWRLDNWLSSLAVFAFVGILSGVVAAFRPAKNRTNGS